MAKPQLFTAQQVKEAMKDTGGIVLAIANKLNCDTETVYNYFKRYPSLAKVRNAEKEKFKDRAESQVLKFIQGHTIKCPSCGEKVGGIEPNPIMTMFYLKCQAKERGYVERTESVVSGSMHVGGKIELTQEQEKKLTEEAFASIMERRKLLVNTN